MEQSSSIKEFQRKGEALLDGYFRPILENKKAEYVSVLKKCILWENEEPFALTAFGNIITIDKDGYVILFNLVDGIKSIICAEADLFFSLVNDPDYQKDYFDIDNFNYARSVIGQIHDDECYTFEPIPALGGSKKRDTISKGKVMEYIMILVSFI